VLVDWFSVEYCYHKAGDALSCWRFQALGHRLVDDIRYHRTTGGTRYNTLPEREIPHVPKHQLLESRQCIISTLVSGDENPRDGRLC